MGPHIEWNGKKESRVASSFRDICLRGVARGLLSPHPSPRKTQPPHLWALVVEYWNSKDANNGFLTAFLDFQMPILENSCFKTEDCSFLIHSLVVSEEVDVWPNSPESLILLRENDTDLLNYERLSVRAI